MSNKGFIVCGALVLFSINALAEPKLGSLYSVCKKSTKYSTTQLATYCCDSIKFCNPASGIPDSDCALLSKYQGKSAKSIERIDKMLERMNKKLTRVTAKAGTAETKLAAAGVKLQSKLTSLTNDLGACLSSGTEPGVLPDCSEEEEKVTKANGKITKFNTKKDEKLLGYQTAIADLTTFISLAQGLKEVVDVNKTAITDQALALQCFAPAPTPTATALPTPDPNNENPINS